MSAVAERVLPSQGVVIAVDPHKASWTAVAVTAGLAAAGAVRVEASRAGYRQLRRFRRRLVRCSLGNRGRDRTGCAASRAAG